ncbi:MAG: protein-glutamate O-methyltransferase CheR [Deltaproteobacteria bacterium]|nr:protein-glutamate O-methyltransferase CheR [Deltaproteobacteria bacterium]
MWKINTRQFEKLSKLVYHECGINLHDGKRELLQARLAKRLRNTGINSIDKYIKIIEKDSDELINFLDAISTNHTFFFREKQHFEVLQKGQGKIWCAASSSGEEPYSIAIDCLEKGFSPDILATDISTHVLRIGTRGVYSFDRVKQTPPYILKKYFQKGHKKWDGYLRVKDNIRRMVLLQRFNLLTDPLPTGIFDVIFCRNVLIYFDGITKTKVVNRLCQVLKPNGYFVIGGAESLNNINHKLQYVKPSIYVRNF